MSRYLPAATQPWANFIKRKHHPTGSYQKFRRCLRWEFGFSCAVCLLHEVDLMIVGTRGWSLMQVEHAIPQSESAEGINRYRNCFLICERCNKARGAIANSDAAGGRLLNPCDDRWSDHFVRMGDEIQPRNEDRSARYTWETYDLDDPSKVTIRARRRHWVESVADALVSLGELEDDLLDQAVEDADDTEEERLKAVKQAKRLRGLRTCFLEKLDEYTAVPPDADSSCSCNEFLDIPKVLADQTIDLGELLRQARQRRDQDEASRGT